jgi:hypothetical protein
MSNLTSINKPATHFNTKYKNCSYILDTELTSVLSNAIYYYQLLVLFIMATQTDIRNDVAPTMVVLPSYRRVISAVFVYLTFLFIYGF